MNNAINTVSVDTALAAMDAADTLSKYAKRMIVEIAQATESYAEMGLADEGLFVDFDAAPRTREWFEARSIRALVKRGLVVVKNDTAILTELGRTVLPLVQAEGAEYAQTLAEVGAERARGCCR